MKPVSLRINGLNSFRQTVTVDFQRLMEDGLFGIFGPTGSGKSSILDAMTLALYGRVRRAPGGKSGIINMREKHCSVSFTFQTGNGDGSRRCYTVERTFGQSRSGGVETRRVRLIAEENEERVPLAEKQSEVDDLICREILGIDHDDFFRAVVLPQGAFADFLFLTPKDRATALQRLFGLHDLGQKLTIRLKAKAGDLKLNRAALDARLSELERYNNDALATCEAEYTAAEELRIAVRTAFDNAKRRYDEAMKLHELIVEYQAVVAAEAGRPERERQLGVLRDQLAVDERSRLVEPSIKAWDAAIERYAEAQRQYNQSVADKTSADEKLTTARERFTKATADFKSYDALCDEINRLEQIREKKDAIVAQRDQLHTLEDVLSTLTTEFEQKRNAQESLAQEVATLEEKIATTEKQLADVTIYHDERELLGELERMMHDLKRRNEELVMRRKERTQLSDAIEQLSSEYNTAHEKEKSAGEKVEALQRTVASVRQERLKIESQREELRAQHSMLESAVERLTTQEEQRARVEKELRDICATSDNVANQRGEVERALAAARADETAAQHERDEISRRREHQRQHQTLALLAAELHDGTPCALCGSTSHPAPFALHTPDHDFTAIDAELRAVESRLLAKSGRVREIDVELAKINAQVESNDVLLSKANDAMKLMREQLASTIAEIETATGLRSLPELRTARDSAVRSIQQHATELAALDERIGVSEFDLEAGRLTYQNAKEESVSLGTSLRAKREHLAKLETDLADLDIALSRAHEIFTDRAGGSAEDVEVRIDEAKRKAQESERLNQAVKRLREECNVQVSRSRQAEADANTVREKKSTVEADHRSLKKQIDEAIRTIQEQLNEIIPEAEHGRRVEVLIDERREKSSRLQRDYDEAKDIYDQASNHDKLMAMDHDRCWKQLCAAEKERGDADRSCAGVFREHGFNSRDEAVAGLLAADDRRRLNREVEAITEELRTNELRRQTLEVKIDGRSIEDDEVAAVKKEANAATEDHEAAIGAAKAAEARLQECRERNAEWKELMQNNEALIKEKSTVDQLTRYLVGDAFVNFIANERLVSVCARASRQLRELTGGRLELDSRPDDGFYIRDNGNGGHERAPSTLSGGETFLVSLSLALALSDTIQLGSAPLEFFFLDEGFGTLDSELLELVMTSLEHIRSQHRAIGIITHVGALRERIGRRLIVTPANALQGSMISYEVA